MIRTYIYLLAALLGIAFASGLAGPHLISSASDFGVAGGFILIALLPPYLWVLYRSWSATKKKARKRQPKFGR